MPYLVALIAQWSLVPGRVLRVAPFPTVALLPTAIYPRLSILKLSFLCLIESVCLRTEYVQFVLDCLY